jgi:uncharacterized protein YjiK
VKALTASIVVACAALACGQTAAPEPSAEQAPLAPTAQAFNGFARADLSRLVASPVLGLTRAANGHIYVLAQEDGLLELDAAGKHIGTRPFGEAGLMNWWFTDVAALSNGDFVLTAQDQAVRYSPETETLVTWFCVEPELDPAVTLANNAVTVDSSGGRIITAPAWFEADGSVRNAWHSQYRVSNGERLRADDVTSTGIVANGLAYDGGSNRLFAVKGDRAHVFALDGERLRSYRLEGIDDASGAAADGDVLFVLDQADAEIRTFDLTAMRD